MAMSEKIKIVLLKRKLTVTSLAKALGMSQSNLSNKLSRDNFSEKELAEIAEAFGISVRTLNRWKKDHDSFMVALTAGKDQADAKVERKLYERAVGYKYTEKETVLEMDADGNRKPLKVRTVEKQCPPDVLAQMYWLNNRKSSYYKRNPENFIKQETIEADDDVVFYLPDNGRDGEQNE